MANVAAVLLLLAASYAQVSLAHFVADGRWLWALRVLLMGLGGAVGWQSARVGMLEGAAPAALFFIGFGLVHLPAAIVLLLKARRGEGRT